MFAKPEKEHQWLERLVGDWVVESECQTGPDQPPETTKGRMTCRSLGGLWTILESEGESTETGTWSSIMTLGYDLETKRYMGTFIASIMSHLWLYSGSVDESGRKLTLDTEGPKFNQDGLAKYQDIIEIVGDDHWVLTSQILEDDGTWQQFMSAHHWRRNQHSESNITRK